MLEERFTSRITDTPTVPPYVSGSSLKYSSTKQVGKTSIRDSGSSSSRFSLHCFDDLDVVQGIFISGKIGYGGGSREEEGDELDDEDELDDDDDE